MPIWITIVNDPEGMTADDATIAGADYRRGDGETREAFHARLWKIALEKGAPVIAVGSDESERGGPSLAELRTEVESSR
jgi:hypothetical protein